MAVIIQCPHCQQKLEIDQDPSGMELECPVCRKHFIVAAEAAGEAAEPQQDALYRQLVDKIGNEALNWDFQGKSIEDIQQMLSDLNQYTDEPGLKEIRQRFIWQVYNYAAGLEAENTDLALKILDCIPELSEAGDLYQAIVLRKLQNQEKQDSRKRKRRIITVSTVFIVMAILTGVIVFYRVPIGAYLGIAFCQTAMGEKLAAADKDSEAVKWYRKAAEQGHAQAQFLLGGCYKDGSGVTKDYVEAVKWYRKAAEQGYKDAQFMLGACYEFEKGVTNDYVEAVKWYHKAAEQGHVMAQSRLANCYERGTGVTKDYAEAAKWYLKAAEQGEAHAQTMLGYYYRDGKGVTKDYAEAAKWGRKAAEQGHAPAQIFFAGCYIFGWGVPKNNVEAVKWLRLAEKQEETRETAQKMLAILIE